MNLIQLKWLTIFLSIGFIVSSFGCIVLAYLWIDRAMTLSYCEVSHHTTANAFERLSSLLESEWRELPEKMLLKKLEAEANRHPKDQILIKQDPQESVIWFDDIRFELKAGRLSRIN